MADGEKEQLQELANKDKMSTRPSQTNQGSQDKLKRGGHQY